MTIRNTIGALVLSLGLAGCAGTQLEPEVPIEEPVAENDSNPAMIACGDDINCFIDAAETCAPAQYVGTQHFNYMGGRVTWTNLYEIRGQPDVGCEFYIRSLHRDVRYGPEAIEYLRGLGHSHEEIREREQMMWDFVKEREGTEGRCLFETDDLYGMLERWSERQFSTDDWENARCTGDFFSQ